MVKKFFFVFSFAVLTAVLLSSSSKEKTFANNSNYADTAIFPLYALAKDFKGVNVSNAAGLITFTSGLDNDYYQLDYPNRSAVLYIEAKTAPFLKQSVKRTPLNLSVVIDRSGSMAGEKMEFARKAAKDIIDKLLPEDFVSVVIYDEYIDVLHAATPVIYKDSIKKKIDKIKPRGSTNLWGGSERGYEQVKANYKKNYINRVLLISDGRANAGTVNPQRIKTKVQEYKDIEGITISTFGVGLDYNETLMTEMAENGAGNYYFIDKADKMAAIFDKELNGLLNVVGQDAELRITVPKGVTLDKVYPFKYQQQGADIVIKFRDLFSEESKGVMLYLKLDKGLSKELKFVSKLTYTDVIDGKQKFVSNINNLNPIKNVDAYMTYFNKPVIEQVVLFTANENLEKAMIEADKGHYETARRFTFASKRMINAFVDSAKRGGELQKMYLLSDEYDNNLRNAATYSKDSLEQWQKSSRSDNYKIRNKKN